ncbi:homoserine O-acetyltransferase [Desulfurispirillum indicum S5]|uniref:Homoserine O-acetyltransferase n=1 Tax=Desulfurispirillum indicum (strain ATCC BAA-1389 / DSM 22839 / S5) TaxID=653733 RepID=E6W315_DESIS|nr:homoserine O-acetyltransferase [Desulfurispirillum indicum]ADU65676.1 homoserine O-acetyltransferase [Desulfurispirillum indicum S5]
MDEKILVQARNFRLHLGEKGFFLESGRILPEVSIAYETYGTLNADKSNAILVCHALTGSAHAAHYHSPDDQKPGWWDDVIGPGKTLDTNTYFIICSNILGGCNGTTGPRSINPLTGRRYDIQFPVVTIKDMVHAQWLFLKQCFQIERLHSVIGGSLGGMQVLEWAISYPEKLERAIVIAATGRISAQALAMNKVGRQAIMRDPNWKNGNYPDGAGPVDGLSIARMMGHISYLSYDSMQRKFGRDFKKNDGLYDFFGEFQVESYLNYNGYNFAKRFDANSYLYITKAMDLFDVGMGNGYREILSRIRARTLVVSIASDMLFPPWESEELFRVMHEEGVSVSYYEMESDVGHDGFLVDYHVLNPVLESFIGS